MLDLVLNVLIPFRLGGDAAFLFSPLTLSGLAILKQWAQTSLDILRRNAWDARSRRYLGALSEKTLDSLPDAHHDILAAIFGCALTAGLIESNEGIHKILWLMVRGNYPQFDGETSEKSQEFLRSIERDCGSADKATILSIAFGLTTSNLLGLKSDPLSSFTVQRESATIVDWAAIYRSLARDYGWRPQDVEQLTLTQLRVYLTPTANPDGWQP